jgi:putative ABC transport system substrate-binding protein
MGGKWLDLLKQMTPTLKRCLVMFGPQSPQSKFWIPSIEAAGPALGVEVTTVAVHNAAEIERAFEQVAREPNVGVVVPTDDVLNLNNELVVKLANLHRLPAIYANPQFLTHGGLMYYGYVREEQFRQAAIYVDRILKGTKPGDLPIQAPNRFQLVINLKTAKALGIEVPLGLLLRADELVE